MPTTYNPTEQTRLAVLQAIGHMQDRATMPAYTLQAAAKTDLAPQMK